MGQRLMNDSFFKKRALGFRYAGAGIWTILKSQTHARIHAIGTLVVIGAGFLLDVSKADWLWLITAISMVWIAEALNTAIEFLADATSPDYHPLVKKSKDAAAGAVLLAVIGAVTIGVLILGSYLMPAKGCP